MNKLTQKLSDVMHPKSAIIVYKSQTANEYYLEHRKIDPHSGRMTAGSPLSENTLGKIMATLAVDNSHFDIGIHGRIPANLLYCDTRLGNTTLVWYNPPEKRKLYFTKNAGINDGEMIVPGLLYVVKNNRLALYAFKGQKPKKKLYMAPFMNVDSTHVCLGTAKVRKPEDRTFENMIAYWEKMFWQSEFGHILGDNPVKGNLSIITKECISTGKPFPVNQLKPIKKTLNDFLR